MGPGAAPPATAEIAADIKKLLRKQEFPTVALEAIGQLQRLLANFVGMTVSQQVSIRNTCVHRMVLQMHP